MLPVILRNRVNSIGPSYDDFIEKFLYGWQKFDKETEFNWTPRVDVYETDKEVFLDVELPGMSKKDIKVEVKDNILMVSGERKQKRDVKENDFSRVERYFGKFERSFALPETVEGYMVAAQFKDGVLTLSMPKAEKAIPKQIEIQVK